MPRLSVDLTETHSEAVDRLAGRIGETRSGVIRVALILLGIAVEASDRGEQLATINDGAVTRLVGLWDTPRTEE